ncbi:MAG TPA: thiamine pyrophosphate-binding protein [Bryobacteraceae bacterium]|nr:thiamine pyrophosphate-binding protein [Bryobacteraceae bacterium]
MPNGAALFVREAARLGIDTIFTLVGDHLNEVLLAAGRGGIRILDMRHESGVTHAADAWARIHRRPALSLVTGGPGHTNSLTGVATAQLAASPLIAVSGSRSTALAGRHGFQDIPQVAMAAPVTKWAAEPREASEIPHFLARAYGEANAGRRGAVHLTIPVNLFTADAAESSSSPAKPAAPAETDVSHADVGRAVEMLRQAERPVVIAGSGVWWAGAEEALRRFIERTSLPLYTITMGRGAVSDEHPLCMGFADPALNPAVRTAFHEADVVLVLVF